MNSNDLSMFLGRVLAPVKNKISLMIGRAVIAAVKDEEQIQTVQLSVLAGESLDDVPRIQDFGFSSNPPVGADAIIACVGGSREGMVVIATEHKKFRFKGLQPGEAVQYTDDGSFIRLKKGGKFSLTNSSGEELITILSELLADLIAARVITSMGPEPFTPADVAKLTALKTRLDTFKG